MHPNATLLNRLFTALNEDDHATMAAWHLVIAPVLLGSGEHLLAGLDLPALGYACTAHAASDKATHVVFTKRV